MPQAKSTSAPSTSARRPQIVNYQTASVAFSDAANPAGPLVAGQPLNMTMTLGSTANVYPISVGSLTYTLPALSGSTGVNFMTAGGPSITTDCSSGYEVTATTQSGSTQIVVSTQLNNSLAAPCHVYARVVAPAAGTYSIGGFNAQNSTFVFGNLSDSGVHSFVVTGPLQHLYVPVRGAANPGSIQIYDAIPSAATLTCTLSDPAHLPNPIAVAANPGFGYIYALDASGVVEMFKPINEGNQCVSTPIGSWTAPQGSTAITVDSNNDVVVSSCSQATWYSGTGTTVAQVPAGNGYCFGDISANYWTHHVIAQELNHEEMYVYNTTSGTPQNVCGVGDGWPTTKNFWHVAAGQNSDALEATYFSQQIGQHTSNLGALQMWTPCLNNIGIGKTVTTTYMTGVTYDLFTQVAAVAVGTSALKPAATYSPYILLYNSSLTLTTPDPLGSINLGSGYYITGIDFGP